MSFETDFLELMPDTVTIAPWASWDEYSRPTYGTPVSYRARVVGKAIALRRRDKTEDTVIFDVFVQSNGALLTVHDLLTLPAALMWQDHTPVIFAVGNYTDPDGPHHAKLQCGWMYHRQGQ